MTNTNIVTDGLDAERIASLVRESNPVCLLPWRMRGTPQGTTAPSTSIRRTAWMQGAIPRISSASLRASRRISTSSLSRTWKGCCLKAHR